MWVAMLIAMLVTWVRDGEPIYPAMRNANGSTDGQTIAYISDVGAYGAQPLFITGSVITVVFLDLAILSERWLRHAGQLVPNKGWIDKTCAILSIFFAIAGAAGLILLSIFNTADYPNLHDGFLALFIVGYLISAILICVEYLRIGLFYRSQHRVLLVSFCIKLSFVIIEIALAIAFGVLHQSSNGKNKNPAAVIEWVISFVFTGWVLSFAVDLLPSVRTRKHVPQGEKRQTMSMAEAHDEVPTASLEEPLTTDSANYYRGQRV
ncbi:FK506 suppressor Sfk1 [Penicillium angulare]|uniref:FK506 suppressor Sfk1 n=1 Tax=Penicillium angulare TaxID=116970 RepID=UPI0025403633|nr:FK506 suppressor Sfk1 [Penicillium angulare]KAJ5257276.1 FK506 suppressor Sfk1 [Penicillium angulare]